MGLSADERLPSSREAKKYKMNVNLLSSPPTFFLLSDAVNNLSSNCSKTNVLNVLHTW